MLIPMAWKNNPIAGSNFAPPQGIIFIRPPNNWRSFESTNLSAKANCFFNKNGIALLFARKSKCFCPTEIAQWNIIWRSFGAF